MTENGKKHSFNRNDIIDKIIDLRLSKGYSRTSLLDLLKSEEYGYSQSYSYELIREASKEFEQRTIQNFGEDIKEDIERFEKLYEKAMKDSNMREAREVLKEISKLKGHYVERVQVTGEMAIKNIEININKRDEDRGNGSIS